MWCANCEDDVATEISLDGQALKCTTCGDVVKEVFAPSLHPETKSARDLLRKWSEEQKQRDREAEETSEVEGEESGEIASGAAIESVASEVAATGGVSTVNSEEHVEPSARSEVPHYRVDSAHHRDAIGHGSNVADSRRFVAQVPVKSVADAVEEGGSETLPVEQVQREQGAFDFREPQLGAGSEVSFETVRRQIRSRPGRAESIWGQLLAYVGVGVLTIGSVFVLWGYFGMVERYASTGWLLATAGQMLLLLGVVTLVSGGMQQTKHEVSERIEYLGGRMIRIEQSTERLLKGPHYQAVQSSTGSGEPTEQISSRRKPA